MDLWTVFLINLVLMVLIIGSYVYFSLCLMAIADKESAEGAWMAWIPIAHVYLMCRMVGASPWTMLLLLVPVVNIGYYGLLWIDVSRDLGRPGWWGAMIFVPVANLIIPGFLAFADAKKEIPVLETPPAGADHSEYFKFFQM